jgi:hypothetical protein
LSGGASINIKQINAVAEAAKQLEKVLGVMQATIQDVHHFSPDLRHCAARCPTLGMDGGREKTILFLPLSAWVIEFELLVGFAHALQQHT